MFFTFARVSDPRIVLIVEEDTHNKATNKAKKIGLKSGLWDDLLPVGTAGATYPTHESVVVAMPGGSGGWHGTGLKHAQVLFKTGRNVSY